MAITKKEAKRAESMAVIISEYVPLHKDGRLIRHVNAKIADWKIVVKALECFAACTPGKEGRDLHPARAEEKITETARVRG